MRKAVTAASSMAAMSAEVCTSAAAADVAASALAAAAATGCVPAALHSHQPRDAKQACHAPTPTRTSPSLPPLSLAAQSYKMAKKGEVVVSSEVAAGALLRLRCALRPGALAVDDSGDLSCCLVDPASSLVSGASCVLSLILLLLLLLST